MISEQNILLSLKNVKKFFKKKQEISKLEEKIFSKIKNFFFPKYEKIEVLKWISLEIKKWEKVAFIWPNWAWKSTTIKSILWILHYNEWEISLFWKDPRRDREKISKKIWSVFGQRSQLLYHLPLQDSFNFFKIIYEIPEKVFQERLKIFVEKFEMWEILQTPVRKLSLWQRMKWEIICSLLHSPEAIFLDEPTVWLDIVAKKVMHEILLEIHKKENLTIFLTSHDIKDIETICDRVVIIDEWKIIFDWEISNLLKKFWDEKILKFIKNWEEFEKRIKNSSEEIKNEIDKIYSSWKIEDLQIENIWLEEVITKVYWEKIK